MMPRRERLRLLARGLLKLGAVVLIAGAIGMGVGIAIAELTGDEEPPAVERIGPSATAQAPATTSTTATDRPPPARRLERSARERARDRRLRGPAPGLDAVRTAAPACPARRAGEDREPRHPVGGPGPALAAGGAPADPDERRAPTARPPTSNRWTPARPPTSRCRSRRPGRSPSNSRRRSGRASSSRDGRGRSSSSWATRRRHARSPVRRLRRRSAARPSSLCPILRP